MVPGRNGQGSARPAEDERTVTPAQRRGREVRRPESATATTAQVRTISGTDKSAESEGSESAQTSGESSERSAPQKQSRATAIRNSRTVTEPRVAVKPKVTRPVRNSEPEIDPDTITFKTRLKSTIETEPAEPAAQSEPAAPARPTEPPQQDQAQDGMHTMDGQVASPQARIASRNLDPSQLYRGRARMALLRDLAMGEWSDRSIADSVGVPVEIISDFRDTYAEEISEVKAALAGQLAIESAGLWISKRYNRIAEFQSDWEDIDLVIDVMRKNTREQLTQETLGSDTIGRGDAFDANLLLGSRRHQNLLRSKIAIMKAVSDEYAPNKRDKNADSEADDNSVRYIITSDNPDDDIIASLT